MKKITGLLCLAMMISASSPASAAATVSKWMFGSLEDPMTDEVSEMAAVRNGPDMIWLRCWPAKPEAGIVLTLIPAEGIWMLASETRLMKKTFYVAETRFDTDPPTRSVFTLEANSLQLFDNLLLSEAFSFGPERTTRLLRHLDRFAKARSLKVRMQKRDGTSASWVFDLTGVGEAIDYLGANCPKNAWLAKD